MPFVIFFIVVLAVTVVRNIRIVSQGYCFIIERMGEYVSTWEAGLHIKVPFIDRVAAKVSLKEQVLDFPPQPVITRDNVTISIDSVVYAHIFDPVKYTYGIENALMGLQNLTATTLRAVIGDMELDQTLCSRAEINDKMQVILDEATDAWGLKVTRVEVKNIQPPREIEEVMTKQMRAERERRQTLLEAQAHKEAVVSRAEGDKQAKILAAEAESEAQRELAKGRAEALEIVSLAEALSLKRLAESGLDDRVLRLKGIQAMKDIADGQATKVFIPTDIASSLTGYGLMGEMLGTAPSSSGSVPRSDLRASDVRRDAKTALAGDKCMPQDATPSTRSAAASSSAQSAAAAARVRTQRGSGTAPSAASPVPQASGPDSAQRSGVKPSKSLGEAQR